MKHAIRLLLILCCACGESGGARVELSLAVSGTAPRTLELGAARLTLTRADVAFGPAYFCASEGARAELCEVALAELRETVLVRALEPAPVELGVLAATTGEVRSALYDYGIFWLLTEPAPRASPAAPEGHSALLEGALERAGRVLRFRAAIDVKPRVRGDAALNGQRTQHVIAGRGERVTVTLDPHRWLERLDPDALFALDGDGDGLVDIEPATTAYESILQGMTSRAPASFVWSSAP